MASWPFSGSSFFVRMNKHKRMFLLLVSVMFVLGGWQLGRPYLFIKGEGKTIAALPAAAGDELLVGFIHSVQKTPVEEYLVVEDDGLMLKKTRYRSLGVGLPFLETEGVFKSEEGWFVFENMNRKFSSLSLRPGVGTRLTVTFSGQEYRLYELVLVGEKVDISLGRYYERLFR